MAVTARQGTVQNRPLSERVDTVLSTRFKSDPLTLGSDLRKLTSPLRASGGHFATCGDRSIFAQK